MASNFFYREKKEREIGWLIQKSDILHKYPKTKFRILGNMATFEMWFQPSPVSPFYKVFIYYPKYGELEVWTHIENYDAIKEKNIPHIYIKNDTKKRLKLCLYYGDEFKRGMLITESIIPWTVEWLHFFEIWLATGKWLGGGHEPSK